MAGSVMASLLADVTASYAKARPRANHPSRLAPKFSQKIFAPAVEIGTVAASLGYRNLKHQGNDMLFTVTPLYALPLAVIFLILWFRISGLRAATKISYGDGGNPELLRRVRQHGNFVE